MSFPVTAQTKPKVEQVAILAGGLGTRLRPITEKIPKPLVAVAGEPFLHWQLEECKRQGYKKILLLVSYLGEQIEAHFDDGADFGLEISYSYEKTPMGTGGALKNALPLLEENFFLLNGDSFLSAPMREMEKFFLEKKAKALVSTYDNRIKTPVIPNLKVEENFVSDYKKNAGEALGFQLIDSGVYILSRDLIERSPGSQFMLEELWPVAIAEKSLLSFPVDERFYDIGTPERLKEFEEKVHDYFAHTVSH